MNVRGPEKRGMSEGSAGPWRMGRYRNGVDLALNDTAAIVCGASSGIGLAVSRTLAAEGCAVTMVARDPARLEQAASGVPGALAVAGDVRDAEALERAVERTVAARGRLDIVVNNAGGPPAGSFESTAPEAWSDAFELSLHAAVRLTRIALPHLKQSGRGRIVNIASWSVREPIPGLVLSNAVRPGIVGLAKTLSHEFGRYGITVNTVAPGKIDTPRARELAARHADPEAARRQDLEAIPVGRIGTAEEVAAAVAFLCSVAAGYVSGCVLPVDGGALRGIW
jgi:3-oxoacyl-[acyl-carrier protein] reductase